MSRRKKRIVVALGGNALGNTPEEQVRQVRSAAEIIADLAAEGGTLPMLGTVTITEMEADGDV